ncbi:MAG: hypothetical protein DYH12_35880, partial [Sorangiineae bacterium PRO1]|nr:hypothetical protein [Sorangiineae bacterium PRO1]
GAGPDHGLAALVAALLALVESFASRPLGATAAAVLGALRAVLARAQQPTSGSLVAHHTGPVVGLRLAHDDPDDASDPLPAESDPILAALGEDVIAVLDAHHDRVDASPAACELHGVLWGVVGLTRAYLNAPTGKALAYRSDPATPDNKGTPFAELRLVSNAPAATQAPTDQQPPALAPLGPVHSSLAHHVLSALESLARAQRVRTLASLLLAQVQRGDATAADLDDVVDDLAAIDRHLFLLGDDLCEMGELLTGEAGDLPPMLHALALQKLIAALDPEHAHLLERRTLSEAARAFATST